MLAFDAVARLRRKGVSARRLQDGFPEWQLAGLPVRETDLNRSEWSVAKTTSTVRAPAGRQRVHYLGLRQPRRSYAQDMPAGQQRDAQAIEQQLLAEHDRLQLGLQVRKTPITRAWSIKSGITLDSVVDY